MDKLQAFKSKPVALVVDDRLPPLKAAIEVLQRQGYIVETAQTLTQAKRLVLNRLALGGYELIVSDYDLGGPILKKYKMFDGYRFLKWCHKQQIGSTLILHSTVFEPHKWFSRWFHGRLLGIIPKASRMNITVQPKSKLLSGTVHWKLEV